MANGALLQAREVQYDLISKIAQASRTLLLDPEPGPKIGEAAEALDVMLDAAVKTIAILSTSSHPSYAERDLPADTTEHLGRARHAMRLLRATYGPQPVPPL